MVTAWTKPRLNSTITFGLRLVVSRLHGNDAGVPGLLFRGISCDFFLRFFFFNPTDRPTQISGNAFDAKRKRNKGGWPTVENEWFICVCSRCRQNLKLGDFSLFVLMTTAKKCTEIRAARVFFLLIFNQ